MTEPDRILNAAEAELANTQRLIKEHVAECNAPRIEPGSLTGACALCRSLATHRDRCERQVALLASEDAETGALF